MTIYHSDFHKRKRTGGVRGGPYKNRRAFDIGREPILTTLGESDHVNVYRVRGGVRKYKLNKARQANVALGQGRVQRTEILSVLTNPSSELYQRRGIINKGAVIRTSIGPAKVTSRPGSDSSINAVLIEDKRDET